MSRLNVAPGALARVAAALLAVGLGGSSCGGAPVPAVVVGVDACARCNMVIDRVDQAAGLTMEGRFVPFDSPVCLLRAFEGNGDPAGEEAPQAHFAAYGSGTFHGADSTWFVLTGRIPTVMEGQVVCFDDAEAAGRFAAAGDTVTNWDGFRLARGNPDRRVQVTIGPGGMEPPVVEAHRGNLVWLEVRTEAPRDGEVELTIRGYEDAGPVRVPAGGEVAVFRFYARRPGAGFPVVPAGGGAPLGIVRITGAHTPDEEAR